MKHQLTTLLYKNDLKLEKLQKEYNKMCDLETFTSHSKQTKMYRNLNRLESISKHLKDAILELDNFED